jgi:hypothetical protein
LGQKKPLNSEDYIFLRKTLVIHHDKLLPKTEANFLNYFFWKYLQFIEQQNGEVVLDWNQKMHIGQYFFYKRVEICPTKIILKAPQTAIHLFRLFPDRIK